MSSGGGKRRTRVGKYEIGKTLGEGSFAKVKFARNLVTGYPVAIKILDRERDHKMVEQMKREISTMKLIKHPNVLNLFEDCHIPNPKSVHQWRIRTEGRETKMHASI